MDSVLSNILLQFKAASEHWAVDLITLLEPSYFVFAKLALLLLILAVLVDQGRFFGAILIGLLWLGTTHVLFLHGWEWASDISHGVRQISMHLGAPAYDPSAIIELGAYIAAPVMKSVGNQGLFNFSGYLVSAIFALAGIMIFLAFCILAFIQFAFLLTNYLLIGGAPFFLLWFPIPGLNMLSHGWIRLACGNLAGLFVTGLVTGITADIGRALGERYQLLFADAAGIKTLTWVDYAEPLGTGFVLAFVFALVPLGFAFAGTSVAGSLFRAGSMALGGLGAAVGATTQAAKQATNTVGDNGGSQPQVTSQGGNTSGGNSGMGPASRPTQGAWNSNTQQSYSSGNGGSLGGKQYAPVSTGNKP